MTLPIVEDPASPEEVILPIINDPVRFSKAAFGVKLWGKARDILYSVDAFKRTTVRACHASSKTFTASLAALWWLVRYPEGIVITTGPTWTQVEALLWSEIHKRLDDSRRIRFPIAGNTLLRVNPANYLRGISTDKGVRFRGWHGDVFVIIDEGPGVQADIYDEVEGMMAGGNVRILVLGNPTVSSGRYFDSHHSQREKWNALHIAATETPNLRRWLLADGLPESQLLTLEDAELLDRLDHFKKRDPDAFLADPWPMLMSRDWVLDHGDWYRWQDPQWNPKVMGRFPQNLEDQLIWLEWCELARTRDSRLDEGEDAEPIDAGLDASGEGSADTTLVLRQGSKVIKVFVWAGSGRKRRGDVIRELRPFHETGRLRRVMVDDVGVGQLMLASLLDNGFPAIGVNVGLPPQGRTAKVRDKNKQRFNMYKAQLCWALRERMAEGDFAWDLEDVTIREKAMSQFTSVRFEMDERGRICIERKKLAEARGVPSPDIFDATVLSFAQPLRGGIPQDLEPVRW